MSWDGHNWNLNNNRLFEARFEKYLNASAETSADAAAYQALLNSILAKLGPDQISTANVDEAFRLLKRAAGYEIDAHLCDALADAVYSVWRATGCESAARAGERRARTGAQTKRMERAGRFPADETRIRACLEQQGRDRAMGQG